MTRIIYQLKKEHFDTFNREQNLDVFYFKIFAGDEKQVPL